MTVKECNYSHESELKKSETHVLISLQYDMEHKL